MNIAKGDLVLAIAGREKGLPFFVLEVQEEYLLLSDGKHRKLESPKRKKQKHVSFLAPGPESTAAKIRSNQIITNSELRKAIAAFGENGNSDQEG